VFKKKLKKKDIVKSLSNKIGLSSRVSNKLVDEIINILIKNIKEGHLNLKNIGSFKLLKKKERIGRNPKTKEEFVISSRNSISFVPSKKISNKLDKFYE
tara:strand:+ start:1060 stop:1356 length:297 start_codon:yes stop_codon:yes gene_type:complete